MADNKKVNCPDCGTEIRLTEENVIGDILECAECGTEVEILSLDPPVCRELIEEK